MFPGLFFDGRVKAVGTAEEELQAKSAPFGFGAQQVCNVTKGRARALAVALPPAAVVTSAFSRGKSVSTDEATLPLPHHRSVWVVSNRLDDTVVPGDC